MRRLAIALVHHPVLDGQGAIVTTAVTNLDVHDLARSARTYGCSDYFVVHPIAAQRELVERIRAHWTEGSSGKRIPDRKEALSLLRIVESLDAVFDALGGRAKVEVWGTAARDLGASVGFVEARKRLEATGKAAGGAREGERKTVLLVFGTGWGLAPAVIEGADAMLEPIRPEPRVVERGESADSSIQRPGYNHLSVRSACAIALDRLLGAR
jgi:hypothetical protein